MKNFIERLEKLKMTSKTQLVEMYNLAITDAIGIYNELHPSTEIPAPEPEKQANMKKAINLRTLEEFQEFTKVFNPSLLDISHWNMYQEKFSIEIKDGFWGGINSFTGKGYQILTYQEWVKENQPETTVIPFDYDRWKSGDYLRVVTRDGRLVEQLTKFECEETYPYNGVVKGKKDAWTKNGESFPMLTHPNDLHLEIATPKPKQVTTYICERISDGLIGVTEDKNEINMDKYRQLGIIEREQQPDGSFKIISTTLK